MSVSDLTLLRWPRSSGGSLRSLTASITEERRSVTFPLGFCEVWEEEDDEEKEHNRLGLETPWLTMAKNDEEAWTEAAEFRNKGEVDDEDPDDEARAAAIAHALPLPKRVAMAQTSEPCWDWAFLGFWAPN